MSEKTLPIANDDYFLGCPGVFSKLHNFRLQGSVYFIFFDILCKIVYSTESAKQ